MARPPHVPQPETELEGFCDRSIDPLSIISFDGEFKRVNGSFVRLLGYPKADLFSRSALDVLHPDDVGPAREALTQLAEGRDLVGFEARVICADGSLRWLEWNTRSIPELGVVYSVGRDTTERRRADAELREAQRLLEASRDELRMLAEEQAGLRRVATLVARGVPPGEVFEAIAREAGRLLGVDAMHMGRYDTGAAFSVAGWSRAGGHLPVGTRVDLDGANIASLVFRSGRPERIDGYSAETGGTAERLRRRMQVYSSAAVPIVVDGRLWGLMIASSRQERPLPADTESRLLGFTELAEMAIANTEARTELAASRARVVAAGDAERRRVVRDLHDGAQQRLVHTVITMKLARQAFETGGDAGPLLDEALECAEQANVELRELARGILPAMLAREGLRAGLEALASRTPVPVDIDVSVGRLPAAIEATAYFVVAEALTNVAKHSRARRAQVTARVDEGRLRVLVRDDGVGGARLDGGGLVGLGDRLAALDGRFRVETPPGGGTLVAADLPLPD